MGRLLAELEITPQKPLRRAYERDPVAIAKWMEEDYPRIRTRARRRGAKIFFLDEAGVRSDAVLGRTWAPKGQTPEVSTSGRRQSVNAISAVNARGEFWYKVFTGGLNKERFVAFLKSFMRGRKHPVMMIVDGHPAHRARIVRDYVQSLKGKLEIYFLPGYAPELNPDEFVWNHLKKQGVSKKPLRHGESLRARVHADLEKIKRAPRLVRSFFRAPSVAYATIGRQLVAAEEIDPHGFVACSSEFAFVAFALGELRSQGLRFREHGLRAALECQRFGALDLAPRQREFVHLA